MWRSVLRILLVTGLVLGGVYFARPDWFDRLAHDGSERTAPRCELPITYHLGTIGEGFGQQRIEVRAALEDAIAMWQTAVDQRLFRRRRGEGMAVELVYDERQRRAQRLAEANEELSDTKRKLDAQRQDLEDRQQRLNADWESFKANREALRERRQAHHEAVKAWNEGRVERTPERRERLKQTAEGLGRRAKELEQRQQRLNERRQRLEGDREAFQQKINAYNERVAHQHESYNQRSGFRMGEYQQDGGERRIQVYKALGEDELRLVLAHELGHALGIGHVDSPEAIMNPQVTQANSGRSSIGVADRAALIRACGL